jgi:hypothetical protein
LRQKVTRRGRRRLVERACRLPFALIAWEPGLVPNKRWRDLSPNTRRFIVTAGAVEGILKAAALVDLARRPAEQVRGPKVGWAAAIVLINSVGAVPITYFAYGRQGAQR